ncbi:MAG: FAD/NAD(P)-binding oxidoreductase [Halothiobacillaceae bacterium]
MNREHLNRRHFMSLCLAGGAMLLSPVLRADDDNDGGSDGSNVNFALAQTGITNRKVVVVGGGMAGATVAKYLRLWGGSGLEVTVVEKDPTYVSNIMSNLVLSGGRALSSLNYSHASLTSKYGVQVRNGTVVAINAQARTLTLADGTSLPYDRLVLAPGIRFDDAYGLTQADYESAFPHAWHAGAQTQALRDQITGMQSGDTFVMTIPAKPYRCPPGPYERACLVADYLKTSGKSGCKVVVLDENPAIQAEPHNFNLAFTQTHAGIIDYRPGVSGIKVDKTTRAVSFTQGGAQQVLTAKVINVIPPQRAGTVVDLAGVNNSGGGRWAGVDVLSYASTAVPNIHIIGDASATTQPKAGHVANQEAKVCADAIVRAFLGQQPDPAPVTNSACYSPITNSTASWLTVVYQYDGSSKTMVPSGAGVVEAASISSKNFSQMNTWFNTLMADSFA